jgi:hypothetical protein
MTGTLSHFVNFLDRLEQVRELPNGEYKARCPAHDDKSPSLHIALGDDDRILVYCFAGCSIEQICSAVNLNTSDLFTPKPENHSYRQFPPQLRGAVLLRALAHEVLIVELYARALRNGIELSDKSHDRMSIAIERITDAHNQIEGSMHGRK